LPNEEVVRDKLADLVINGHVFGQQAATQSTASPNDPFPLRASRHSARLSATAAELSQSLEITPGDMLLRAIAEIQADIEKVNGKLESLGFDPEQAPGVYKRSGDDLATALAKRLAQLQERLAALIGQNGGPMKVTMDHLLDTAEVEYVIKLKDMTPEEEQRLAGLYDRMESVIFGQTVALGPIVSRFIQAEKAQGRSTPM
jgi:ATP-dependent Clp protease ATP-binding subunit ClpA